MFGSSSDERPPLERAQEAASGLTAGTWESVEALALLAIEVQGPEGARLYELARTKAAKLKSGDWSSVRALTLLARAGRELA
ncbi:hypothetical protein EFK50_06515 [Nocardioides marmoriginsengisoli]|uniref:Uncharacterized protein n=1 Tax=Nocardioides marmoriginsengisoli TaxID=661483 RepID=A0A3N0CLM2_9ACTN|nr:hypothetical protein [Nocardioides marmoriginsengisoli]RNL64181.1 hypothetical protein EFK50_06515 [Nocardioides marmoriginsengisoli]